VARDWSIRHCAKADAVSRRILAWRKVGAFGTARKLMLLVGGTDVAQDWSILHCTETDAVGRAIFVQID
jgi:hypothetical protein